MKRLGMIEAGQARNYGREKAREWLAAAPARQQHRPGTPAETVEHAAKRIAKLRKIDRRTSYGREWFVGFLAEVADQKETA